MSLELIKEEVIGQVKVVKYKDEKYRQIIVRLEHLEGKSIDGRQGFVQYIALWRPEQAEEYFQGLSDWVHNGRQGDILPFRYKGEPWHDEDA